MSFLFDLFGIWRKDSNPTNSAYVFEKKTDEQKKHRLIAKEDSIFLYENESQTMYEVILTKELNNGILVTFSLFRSESQTAAELVYALTRDKLPLIVHCMPSVLTRDNLQSIMDTIKSKPTWTVAHVAAHFGMVDCFRNVLIKEYINAQTTDTQVTPLMVAIKAQQLITVFSLLNMEVNLDLLDIGGDTVFHYAAISNKDIIQTIASCSSAPSINQDNYDGYTPLHMACLADKPDCVTELLHCGANVNISTSKESLDTGRQVPTCDVRDILAHFPNQFHPYDMKNGGTPLHWVKSTQCLEALIEAGCNLNAKNFQGDTALHIMISKTRMTCVMMLLSHGAAVNIQGADENTPLHLAVKSEDISLVQALLTFGASVSAKNKKHETPRHIAAQMSNLNARSFIQNELILFSLHAVGAKRCRLNLVDCSDGCSRNGTYDGVCPDKPFAVQNTCTFSDIMATVSMGPDLLLPRPASEGLGVRPQSSESGQRRAKLLALDGGGIRGLILIQMLGVLEAQLPKPISTYFDWIAGTSTGAILALALALGKSIMDCRCLYIRLKNKVFMGTRPYDTEALEKFLRKELGEETRMSDIIRPKTIVTGVLADRHPAELHIFRNYDSPKTILGIEEVNPRFPPPPPPSEQLVWLAARASGAAPTYFRASGRFVDGGLIANNPTLDALTEICQYNAALMLTSRHSEVEELGLVVSLGTGRVPVIPNNALNSLRTDSFWGYAKIALGASALGQLLLDQVTQTEGRVMERAQAWCSSLKVPYFRLNPPIFEDILLDEVDNRVLMRMCWETLAYMHNKSEDVNRLVYLLKND